MADEIRTVETVDVQLLDAARSNVKTYKFDNPKENLTKAEISIAFQPAMSDEWLLVANGNIAKYIGDVTINTSTKVKLGGEDFYITPNEVIFPNEHPFIITVSGATIQGYNLRNNQFPGLKVVISENGLQATLYPGTISDTTWTATLILVIQGIEVEVPISAAR